MFQAFDRLRLAHTLPMRPHGAVSSFSPLRAAAAARAQVERQARAARALLGRWFDVLGPDLDLSDLHLNDADVQADLQRGRR